MSSLSRQTEVVLDTEEDQDGGRGKDYQSMDTERLGNEHHRRQDSLSELRALAQLGKEIQIIHLKKEHRSSLLSPSLHKSLTFDEIGPA